MGEIQIEGRGGGPNVLRVPLCGKVWSSKGVATRSSYRKKSMPDRTGGLQGRRERRLWDVGGQKSSGVSSQGNSEG